MLQKRKNPHALSAAMLVALILTAALTGCSGKEAAPKGEASATVDSDLVIPIGDVSETAAFYPVEIEGTKLEVIAVKAPDGTNRTAFNTCQVCYSSGRGYYEQEGDVLVCQNCGNRFGMDQVEVQSGGCNPVPIFPDYKTVGEQDITVSRDFLKEATVIFSNWKTEY